MDNSYDRLLEMLYEVQEEQSDEFQVALDTVLISQSQPFVKELLVMLSHKEENYITYSHV
jgi:hypothetical protein